MKIEVKLFSLLRLKIGKSSLIIESEKPLTILELTGMVSEKLKQDISEDLFSGDKIKTGTMILLNGANIIHKDGLNTKIETDSIVSVFPPAGGG